MQPRQLAALEFFLNLALLNHERLLRMLLFPGVYVNCGFENFLFNILTCL